MVEKERLTGTGLHCRNEYAPLQRVLMCAPTYMTIEEVINETQKHYLLDNINRARAGSQFKAFLDFLTQRGIEVELLPESPLLPEQVFTRDIGVVIDDRLVRSRLQCEIRQGDEEVLENWLLSRDLPSVSVAHHLEGGDVMIDGETIWVGAGNRTDPAVAEELQQLFPEREVVALSFAEGYLHLDCVFNVLTPDLALIFKEAFDPATLQRLAQRYELIEVSGEEQFTLGTNVLSLGQGHVVALPQNGNANRLMRAAGLTVHEIDLSEIIKSGGSFRCITLPLRRQETAKS